MLLEKVKLLNPKAVKTSNKLKTLLRLYNKIWNFRRYNKT